MVQLVAVPLLLIGLASRDLLVRWRGRLASAAAHGKLILGLLSVLTGVEVLTGLDKQLETILVQHSPDWLTNLTVKF